MRADLLGDGRARQDRSTTAGARHENPLPRRLPPPIPSDTLIGRVSPLDIVKRRELITGGATYLGVASAGCLAGIGAENAGTVVDAIEILNADDVAHEFRVGLADVDGESIYETSATVSGAPGNEYVQEVLSDLPDEPATAARASIDGDEFREPITDDGGSGFRLTVMCNLEGEIGIATF